MGGGWPPDRAIWVRALARDNFFVFLSKTVYSHSASLHPGVLMGTCQLTPRVALRRTGEALKALSPMQRSLAIGADWLIYSGAYPSLCIA